MHRADNVAVASSTRHRSAITNGRRLLDGIDPQTASARRYRDLVIAFADDLGGVDQLGEADRALVKQAAGMTLQAEALQAALVRGDKADPDQLVRVSNALARALGTIRRKAKVQPKPGTQLREYLGARTV